MLEIQYHTTKTVSNFPIPCLWKYLKPNGIHLTQTKIDILMKTSVTLNAVSIIVLHHFRNFPHEMIEWKTEQNTKPFHNLSDDNTKHTHNKTPRKFHKIVCDSSASTNGHSSASEKFRQCSRPRCSRSTEARDLRVDPALACTRGSIALSKQQQQRQWHAVDTASSLGGRRGVAADGRLSCWRTWPSHRRAHRVRQVTGGQCACG